MASWHLQLTRIIGLIFIVKFKVYCSQESSVAFQDNFLLVTDSADNAIFQIELSTNNKYRLPIFDPLRPIAVTFDWRTRDVYWASNYSSIHRYSFINNSTNTVYSDPQNTSYYVGLTVDVWGRKLYYSDVANGRVGVLTVASSGQATQQGVIDSDTNSKPHQLVLDVTNSLLYWADCSPSAPALYVASTVNNTTKTKLISTGFNRPQGLAIDLPGHVMYIGDSGKFIIESLGVDGSGRYTLPGGVSPVIPYSLAVHSENLYFTDRSTNALRVYNRRTNRTISTQNVPFAQPNGIVIYLSAEVNRTAPLHTTTTAAATTATTFFNQSTQLSPADQSQNNKTTTTTTIIIAVVVSVGGSIVLVLILVFIVVTCRRYKRPGKRPELTKSSPSVSGESFSSIPRYNREPRATAQLPHSLPPSLPPLRPSPPAFHDNHIDSTYLEPTVGSQGQYLSLELDYISSTDPNISHVTTSQQAPAQSRLTTISDDYNYDDAA